MHHFIYPSQNTTITNQLGYDSFNFGLTEVLKVGTNSQTIQTTSPTTIFPITQSVTNFCISGFYGNIIGSLYGNASFSSGSISSSVISELITTNFTGLINGSLYSNFSGSIEGTFSGSISGLFITTYVDYFNGTVNNFNGSIISGSIVGYQTLQQQNVTISENSFVNRALVQFNITSISQSISNGDIENPEFILKLKTATEKQLPIEYQVYIFPISESWVMGNGYYSDGGSITGASWDYRDYQGGTTWSLGTGSSYIQSMVLTQSFDYQIGDIYTDITSIAMAWISGTIENNGVILICSDEFSPSPVGLQLSFFSQNTNTIYEPILDVGWEDFSFVTGSLVTSSINLSTASAGLLGTIVNSGSLSIGLYGCFTGIGNIILSSSISNSYDTSSMTTSSFWSGYSNGLISAVGTCGLINSMSIVGDFSGSYTSSIFALHKKCKTCRPINPDLVYQSDVMFNEQVSQIPFNLSPFYPGAGDDANFSCFPGTPTDADFYVIDGQFPSEYNQPLNVPSFIQAGLAYMSNTPPCSCSGPGLDQSQYQGHDIYGWGHRFDTFNQYDWYSVGASQYEFGPSSIRLNCGCQGPLLITMSFVMGTFVDGIFSGSTFTSSLINNYILGFGLLSGSWNEAMILGNYISSSYPFLPMYPNAVNVSFSGSYINANAFGSLSQLSQSVSSSFINSGIFSGVFTSGLFAGTQVYAPFSGSLLTSSYLYTSSISFTSTNLSPLNIEQPFEIVVQNLPSTVKAGNIIKVRIFSRPQYPLKNFNRQTQFTQFLIPQYLPTSSYYSIKDNETEEIILNFDNYTQISCDQYGNYFLLDTTGYPQERYFRIIIKVEDDGEIYTIDNNNVFKIVR